MPEPTLLIDIIANPLSSYLDPMSWSLVFQKQFPAAPTPAQWFEIGANIVKKFGTGGSTLISSFFPESINTGAGAGKWNVYDISAHLDGSVHGPPVASGTWTNETILTSVAAVPEGVSGVISYNSDYGTDPEFVRDPVTHKVTARPKATHRGRMYLPLGLTALSKEATTNRSIIHPSFISAAHLLTSSLATVAETTAPSNTWVWCQWSKKMSRALVVLNAWVDDRPDYQRRRTDQGQRGTIWTVP